MLQCSADAAAVQTYVQLAMVLAICALANDLV
jgi:hypothetical protein